MATEITIVVGDSYAERHDNFRAELGADYDEQMRQLVEDEIHAVTQQLERQADEQRRATQQLAGEQEASSDT